MFENLMKSEIKKAETAANKFFNRTDCKVTAWSVSRSECPDFYDVTCEICFGYEVRADYDVQVSVFMPDRRRSFATVKEW